MENNEKRARGVALEARVVPVPRSLSAKAQAFLTERAAMPAAAPLPPPEDIAAWRAYVALRDQQMTAMLRDVFARVETLAQAETLAGVRVYRAKPATIQPAAQGALYLDIHGGALVFMGGEACRLMAAGVAERVQAEVVSVDYRMPPDHPYPAGLDDCLAVYRALLAERPAQRLMVGGTSAGGNLAAALALRARDEGLPLPAGLVLLTPELDLTESGDSFETHRDIDVVLPRGLPNANRLYAGSHDLAHPYLSPLFGDFTRGFPPTFLQAGTRDLFLSNVARMHRALRKAQVPVDLHVFEGMPHGGFSGAPEDAELTAEIRMFLARQWG